LTDIEPFQGFGLGLRRQHYDELLAREVDVDFLEIISENYMVDGGRPLRMLDEIRERFPIVMHGVSMSIGAAQGLDMSYLRRLKQLADRIRPLWVSDHLCWTGVDGSNTHDLLPLPYDEETLSVVCANIATAQDVLERPLLFENPSSYVAFPDGDMTEWEFLSAICSRTGCYLLLDVNNVHVSAVNHGFDARDYLAGLPAERIRQVHLAGHAPGAITIDTHDRDVCDAVWDLYRRARAQLGAVATMIERDDNIPALDVLVSELGIARRIAAGERAAA
jgi:uncharacterized protein